MEQLKVSSRPFRILSIDGGGLRGIVAVEMLKYIEKEIFGNVNTSNKTILDSFDLIAGTSTGGLLACAMTTPDDSGNPMFSLDDIANIYEIHGKDIFPQPLSNRLSRWFKSKKEYIRPKYNSTGLKSVLENKLGDKRIIDTLKPIFVPAYDITNFRPIYFSSRDSYMSTSQTSNNPQNFNYKLADICLATSAAPTYFPSFPFNYPDSRGNNTVINCIDGGIYLNNPAMAAYYEVLANQSFYRRDGNPIKEEDIYILSIGTGNISKSVSHRDGQKWGKLGWAKNAIHASMLGTSQTIVDQLDPQKRFLRINVDLENKFSELDDCSIEAFNYLKNDVCKTNLGNSVLQNKIRTFKNLANL